MGEPMPNPNIKIQIPVPGDFAQSALMMSPIDRAQFLRQQTDAFIGKVRETMSPSELQSLPTDTAGYINSMVVKSLDRPDKFHLDLAELVVAHYYMSPNGERYIYDPINKGALFTDEKGELVTLVGAEITSLPKGIKGEGTQVISKYAKAFVWTGPQAEQEFTPQEKPIPEPIIPKAELFVGRQERTKVTPHMRVEMLF